MFFFPVLSRPGLEPVRSLVFLQASFKASLTFNCRVARNLWLVPLKMVQSHGLLGLGEGTGWENGEGIGGSLGYENSRPPLPSPSGSGAGGGGERRRMASGSQENIKKGAEWRINAKTRGVERHFWEGWARCNYRHDYIHFFSLLALFSASNFVITYLVC